MGDGQLFKLSMKRIIPRLDIKGPNLVKGIHLEGLRVLGSPEIFAQHYYENGADEIIFQDVVASLFERNSLHEIISRTAKNIFIPITVGGGIRTIEDIHGVSCLCGLGFYVHCKKITEYDLSIINTLVSK